MGEKNFAEFLGNVNGNNERFTDSDRKPYNGTHVFKGESFGLKLPVIMHFKNGYLDSENGKRPAVEYPGWIEYWENGRRHRDGGFAAVSKEGFKINEIWINGVRQQNI